jgi:hypothetical protein
MEEIIINSWCRSVDEDSRYSSRTVRLLVLHRRPPSGALMASHSVSEKNKCYDASLTCTSVGRSSSGL